MGFASVVWGVGYGVYPACLAEGLDTPNYSWCDDTTGCWTCVCVFVFLLLFVVVVFLVLWCFFVRFLPCAVCCMVAVVGAVAD